VTVIFGSVGIVAVLWLLALLCVIWGRICNYGCRYGGRRWCRDKEMKCAFSFALGVTALCRESLEREKRLQPERAQADKASAVLVMW